MLVPPLPSMSSKRKLPALMPSLSSILLATIKGPPSVGHDAISSPCFDAHRGQILSRGPSTILLGCEPIHVASDFAKLAAFTLLSLLDRRWRRSLGSTVGCEHGRGEIAIEQHRLA